MAGLFEDPAKLKLVCQFRLADPHVGITVTWVLSVAAGGERTAPQIVLGVTISPGRHVLPCFAGGAPVEPANLSGLAVAVGK